MPVAIENPITLPGHIKELYKPGAPVYNPDTSTYGTVVMVDGLYQVCTVYGDMHWPKAEWELNLDDYAGRCIAAKVMAEIHTGVPKMEALFCRNPGIQKGWRMVFGSASSASDVWGDCLDRFNNNNDKQLPDGSQRVAAEALREAFLYTYNTNRGTRVG